MASQSQANSGEERVASTRLTVALHERLRKVAEAEHRTISQELRRLVEHRVDEADEATERKAA